MSKFDPLALPRKAPNRPTAPAVRTYDDGLLAGIAAERLRIAAIVESPAAHDKAQLALKLALTTNMSAEQASVVLSAAQPEASPYERAMQAEAVGLSPSHSALNFDKRADREAEIKENMRAFNSARGW